MNRFVVGAWLSAGALVLAACASGSAAQEPAVSCPVPEGPVSFAIGGRSNTPAVASTPALAATVMAAAANEATVTLVDTGGQPEASAPISLELDSKNGPAQERERSENARSLATALTQVAAATPEANPLEALNRAADAVRSAPGGESAGTIVLVDSGLQTAGALDYTQPGMLAADPADLVESLRAVDQLPDLTGMSVFLVGIGESAAPQEPLDSVARRSVQAQWAAIVRASGAACVDLDTAPRTTDAVAGLPEVSTVRAPEVSAAVPTPENPLELGDEVRFQSNSADLVDPEGARKHLEPIAAWLKESATGVVLTGTTATDGTEAGRLELSKMRAEAVKTAFVEMGVDPGQITTEGVGTHHPSHRDDLGPDGELLPGPAAQNRLVIVSVPQ